MARYFNYFPSTVYSTGANTSGLDIVTNITTRFKFESSLKQNSAAFYKYDIQDSDTPEIIASKFYDNPERHWIILAFNEIYDPQWDWPLQQNTLIKYIDDKYSSNGAANTPAQSGINWALSNNNVHSYYKVIKRTNSDDQSITETIELDANVWANTAAYNINYTLEDGSVINESLTKIQKTFYEYEVEENEKKRKISLLKPEFVPLVEKEFKRIIKGKT